MCRDAEDGWVAVEIKRVGTLEAVEQLSRYLEVLCRDPALAGALADRSLATTMSVLGLATLAVGVFALWLTNADLKPIVERQASDGLQRRGVRPAGIGVKIGRHTMREMYT
jgi:hypothetical protein